jgi:hypothetical protein
MQDALLYWQPCQMMENAQGFSNSEMFIDIAHLHYFKRLGRVKIGKENHIDYAVGAANCSHIGIFR